MTKFGFASTARWGAAVALFAVALAAPAAARAQTTQPSQAAETPRRPLVFIPGLMGSRLCRPNPANPREPIVAWGTLGALPSLPDLRLDRDGEDDVHPCGLIREVVFLGLYTQEVYGPIISRLERLGYREHSNLFVFDYDWRRSVFDNAQALAGFVRDKAGPDQAVDILAHSMGGLIARIYAVELGGGRRISRLFSAGSPFLGSVKVYETAENGFGALNSLVGGIAAFRRALLSFPSIHELAARYPVCCGSGAAAFSPHDAAAWRALGWDGVEPAKMPDLAATAGRIDDLQRIVDTPLPAGVEDVVVVGVDQRTPHRIAFETYGGVAAARIDTTWEGDGTVVRESATLPSATVRETSFADHQNILNDAQVQEFLAVALTGSVGEAVRRVPVRPRDTIRTLVGVLAELVGVAVVPERLVFRPGEVGEVRVQFRLGEVQTLSTQALRLELRLPGAAPQVIALRPDPAASDPEKPFEQTFVGHFAAGVQPGPRQLRATVFVEGGRPRVVEQTIAVLAR